MPILLLFLLGWELPGQNQIPNETIVNGLINHFESLDKIQVSGIISDGLKHPESSDAEFTFYKFGTKAKYIERTVEAPSAKNKEKYLYSKECYADNGGFFRVQNDPESGNYKEGYGDLYDVKNASTPLKQIEHQLAIAGLGGCFAYSYLKESLSPCYTIRELFSISKFIITDDSVGNAKAYKINTNSSWGTITFWVDINTFKPLLVRSDFKSSGLMPNGLILSAIEKDKPYKTSGTKEEYRYFYDEAFSADFPKKIIRGNSQTGLFNGEEISSEGTIVITYTEFKKLLNRESVIFSISSTAKNGTKFHIDNQPQIAYHLEDGQLVLSANHKFLNQISQTVFGGIGFWHRFFLTLGPLLVTGLLALWGWRRFSHKIQ